MTIWLSAGEPSGDRWGALLAAALRRRAPDVRLIGMAGAQMRAAGVENVVPPGEHDGVAGFLEPLRRARALAVLSRESARHLRRERPSVVVAMDYPGFHLHLLRTARRLGVPTVYYIPPQVWAWWPGRARRVARDATFVVTAFEWERPWFTRWMPSDRVKWAGHPLADELVDSPALHSDGTVALLPGSRRSEVMRLAPILADAARKVGMEATFAVHGPEAAEWVHAAAGDEIPVVAGRTGEVLARARAAVVCVGSATLEAACAGVPTVIVYRTDRLTYALASQLVKTRRYGLPNILLRRDAYPELIQRDLTPRTLAEAIEAILRHPSERWHELAKELRMHLGRPGAADRVAEIVLRAAREGAR